ncbi:hypothetical protein BC826DRAFT_689558 [Russula brevipes]|nr:hypothetical protein BC826DRAFT_689558 [Russula brevipes]
MINIFHFTHHARLGHDQRRPHHPFTLFRSACERVQAAPSPCAPLSTTCDPSRARPGVWPVTGTADRLRTAAVQCGKTSITARQTRGKRDVRLAGRDAGPGCPAKRGPNRPHWEPEVAEAGTRSVNAEVRRQEIRTRTMSPQRLKSLARLPESLRGPFRKPSPFRRGRIR